MKTIDAIIIHCSATRTGQDLRAKDIDRMHRARGFNQIGYNYVVDLDGTIESGRPLTISGAHCLGYNDHSVGICYIGGLDGNGQPADTRTDQQKAAIRELVATICKDYPIIEVLGHRDTSPDLNDNGIIEPCEWIKMCPCFEVRDEFENFMRPVIIKPE
jgi:N-acetylmuramoyl-L-alanine amidase